MTNFKPGDVIEIDVSGRKTYVQVTHLHPSYPPVVRAIEGVIDGDSAAAASGTTKFVAMIPLQTALERVGASYINLGQAEIPEDDREFPTFRMPIRDKKGDIVYWWFWDGRGLSYDAELDAAAAKLPMREVITGQRLMELLSDV